MRWCGIRSQNQLARLSGVSQSAIHHILSRGDDYAATRQTLRRLARALGTTPAWLDGETTGAVPLLGEPSPGQPGHIPDGCDAEVQSLMAALPTPTRRKIVDFVRLIAQGSPSSRTLRNGGQKDPADDAPASER
jgi:transcriptional regulator with XRE-family HTH domain